MSLAENLLNTLPNDGENTARIANPSEEPHIIIDENRNIIVPQQLRNIAVTGDKDVETVTFDCVRYWDGHDLSNFAIYLNYTLPVLVDGKKQTGTYIPTEIRRFDNYYSFDWTIDENLTSADGQIEISLVAVRTDEDGYKETQWGSFPNHELTVTKGLPISNVPSIEEKQDILSQILGELNSKIDAGSLVQTTGDGKSSVMSQKAVTDAIRPFATKGDIVRGKPKLTNEDSAYTKDIPINSAPFAELVRLGGMTYKDGDTLQSAPVTEVESVGANLTTAQAVYKGANAYAEKVVDGRNCIRITSGASKKNYPIKFKENTQYTVSFYTKSDNYSGATANNIVFCFWYSDGTQSTVYADRNDTSWKKVTLTSDAGKTVIAVGVFVMEYRVYNYIDIDTFMFNEGSTALPYTPYTKNTLAIPEAVQAIEGYGQSNPDNAEEYNYIDLKNERFAAYGHLEGGVWRAYGSVQYTPIKLDGFIAVEGGGTLTFKNEFGYDVPSEVNIYTNTNSGTGAGDMSMSVYDSNGNGIVDKAENDSKGNNIFDTYASKASLTNTEATLTNLIANLSTKISALTTRVAELESGNSGVIGVGTNVTGKTIRVTCKADAEQTSGETFTVLDFGNGNYIEIDVYNGYYQGYGAFEGVYDTNNFRNETYNGGGTIAVYNKNYILLEYV